MWGACARECLSAAHGVLGHRLAIEGFLVTSGPAHEDTDCEARDPHEGDHGADSVPVADSHEHQDPDCEQGDAPEEPEGNEGLPAIGMHPSVRVHGTGQFPRADEGMPSRLAL